MKFFFLINDELSFFIRRSLAEKLTLIVGFFCFCFVLFCLFVFLLLCCVCLFLFLFCHVFVVFSFVRHFFGGWVLIACFYRIKVQVLILLFRSLPVLVKI